MEEKSKDKFVPPKEDIWDWNYSLTKAALSVAPPLSEFYQLVIKPPFQKRLLEWMETVASECRKNESFRDDFKPENLVKNEVFQSTFSQCSRLAVQTHQKDKLDMLRYALINTVIMTDLEDNYKQLFISYIDSLTPLHMSILKHYRTVRKANLSLDYPYSEHLEIFLAENKDIIELDDNLFTQFCKDLELKSLLIKGKNPTKGAGSTKGFFNWIALTDFGGKFLMFISKPNLNE